MKKLYERKEGALKIEHSLFCPYCGHQHRLDDFDIRTLEHGDDFWCPACSQYFLFPNREE